MSSVLDRKKAFPLCLYTKAVVKGDEARLHFSAFCGTIFILKWGVTATESRNEAIYRELEADIVNLDLHPGDMLSENSLCDRFQVSRTPIRSVLQRLQSEGLVEITPRKGTCVTRIRYNIVSQIIYLRIAVESAIIRDFIGIYEPQDLIKVHHYLDLMEEGLRRYQEGTPPDPVYFYAADKAMHEIWYRVTQKAYLWEYIYSAKADYHRFCMLDMRGAYNYAGVAEEHRALVRAIEEKDKDSIEGLVRNHFERGVRRLGTRVYTDLKDYFDPDSLLS